MIRRLRLIALAAFIAAVAVIVIQFTRPPATDGLTLLGMLLSFTVLGCAAGIYHLEHIEETDRS